MDLLDINYLFHTDEISTNKMNTTSPQKFCGSKRKRVSRNNRKVQSPPKDKNHSTSNLPPITIQESSKSRKIQLSEEERTMDGAPQGDIYSVEVVEVNDLKSFDDLQEVHDILDRFSDSTILNDTNTDWSERFSIIENLRRILHKHNDLISVDLLPTMISLVTKSINSLRSVETKNAIYAMESILIHYYDSLSSLEFNQGLHAIFNKLTNAPKFLIDLIGRSIDHIDDTVNMTVLIPSIYPLIHHTHPNITNRAILSLCHIIIKVQSQSTISKEYLSMIIEGLCIGIYSKKIEIKNVSKDAISYILNNIIDRKQFDAIVMSKFKEDKVKSILHDISKFCAVVSSSKSSTLSLSLSSTKLLPNTSNIIEQVPLSTIHVSECMKKTSSSSSSSMMMTTRSKSLKSSNNNNNNNITLHMKENIVPISQQNQTKTRSSSGSSKKLKKEV